MVRLRLQQNSLMLAKIFAICLAYCSYTINRGLCDQGLTESIEIQRSQYFLLLQNILPTLISAVHQLVAKASGVCPLHIAVNTKYKLAHQMSFAPNVG